MPEYAIVFHPQGGEAPEVWGPYRDEDVARYAAYRIMHGHDFIPEGEEVTITDWYIGADELHVVKLHSE